MNKVKFSSDKDLNRLIGELLKLGWLYRKVGKHNRLSRPGISGFLTVPCSPSDHRAVSNLRRDARRLERQTNADLFVQRHVRN